MGPLNPLNPRRPCRAFSLVELLTVIFIISLLIGILIPSLSSARTAAKKVRTTADISSIGKSLQLFKDDNERDFLQTNGYPPSFVHPPIYKAEFNDNAWMGVFPFLEDESTSTGPVVYGAHWLPAMLMGVDQRGYVSKRSVPQDLRNDPSEWYSADPTGSADSALERKPLYLEPGGVKTLRTQDLRGRPPETGGTAFPHWDQMKTLPVFVDGFDQPILYYAANRYGREANMVGEDHEEDNIYEGGNQESGPPIYFHQDNEGFTGWSDEEAGRGWDFAGQHAIARSGAELTAADIVLEDNRKTFARFITDRTYYRRLLTMVEEGDDIPPATPLKPANADTFLLISAGADGQYGTNDDVTNFKLGVDVE